MRGRQVRLTNDVIEIAGPMDARLHRLLRGLPDATWDIVAAAYHLPQTTYHAGQAVAQLSDDFDIPTDVRKIGRASCRERV